MHNPDCLKSRRPEIVRAEVLHQGEWLPVTEGPNEIVALLRSSGLRDLICLTAADGGRELWLKSAQIDAVAGVASEAAEQGAYDDETFLQGLTELEVGELRTVSPPECEGRCRRMVNGIMSRAALSPRPRGHHD